MLKRKISLVPIKTPEQVEWLRLQRNDPRLYKYFRQDKPITPEAQKRFWREVGSNKNLCRLFQIYQEIDANVNCVGYCGFLPLNLYARRAEFGIFIVPEFQGNGIGKEALLLLLKNGFDAGISVIYSDVLDYEGENRWDFYKSMGFEKAQIQDKQYQKQGQWIKSIKFHMTKQMWDEKYGEKRKDSLGSEATPAPTPEPVKAGKKGVSVSSSKANVNAPAR